MLKSSPQPNKPSESLQLALQEWHNSRLTQEALKVLAEKEQELLETCLKQVEIDPELAVRKLLTLKGLKLATTLIHEYGN